MSEEAADSSGGSSESPSRAQSSVTRPQTSAANHVAPKQGRPSRAADLLPQLTLPKGGGAIRSIGEKFAVNAATGSSQLTVPIPCSRGRSGFTPDLHLSYDSAYGNGPLGLGWSVSVAAISRKTDKGLPLYRDADESDTFIVAGAEDLVPDRNVAGLLQRTYRTLNGSAYEITPYLPRVERGFAKIERWLALSSGISHWRLIDPANVTSLYGFDADSRICHPDDPTQVFAYRISRSWDANGNVVSYGYKREDSLSVDASDISEANRTERVRAAQIYLKSVRYGNLTPWYPNWGEQEAAVELPKDWAFELVLDYGDHRDAAPVPLPDQPWPVRQDAFSSYRAGFEVRTYRLCRRFLMFHSLPPLGAEACLVKSVDLSYAQSAAATFMQSATVRGYLQSTADSPAASPLSLPPVEFVYSQAEIDETVRSLPPGDLMGAPAGVDGTRYQWVDLDGEGLPGILSEQGNGWYYNRNVTGCPVGEDEPDDSGQRVQPRFEGTTLVAERPSAAALSQGRQLLDLAGDGQHCLVEFRRPDAGYYDREPDGQWARFTPFTVLPNLAWADPDLKHIDVDGDGLTDLLISEDEVFTWHRSLGKEGFGPAQTVRKPFDEDCGPAIVFSDRTDSIYLADMSGDGLTDIVRIRNGEVCYWPNLGYGRFGAKVLMDPAPLFDTFDQFDQKRIRLADIDGSGTTDILYLGRNRVTFWFNQAGNRWSEPHTLSQFPDVDNLATVSVVDLLGAGTSCIVWSSALPDDAAAPMRYINLMASGKPHLLTCVTNNLGAQTRIHYEPSTRFYLRDRAEGKPWVTRLPFPVQVVERSEIYDQVSQAKFVARYAYHHGYFDGAEREFRGFGLVEQWDTDSFSRYSGTGLFTATPATAGEEFHLPPVHSKSWFHNGVFVGGDRVSRQYAHEYYAGDPHAWTLGDSQLPDDANDHEAREACRALRGHLLRQEVYCDDGSPQSVHPYTVTEHTYEVRMLQGLNGNRHAVFHAFETESLSYHYERDPTDPRIGHEITLEIDAFGNALKSASIGYPRRVATGPESLQPEPEQTRTLIVYSEHSFANYADARDRRRLGLGFASQSFELTGLGRRPSGPFKPAALKEAARFAAQIPYEATPDPAVAQKRCIQRSRSLYRKDDLSGPLPLGQVESLALPYESYTLALTPGLLKSVFADKLGDAELASLGGEGGYRDLDSDGSWWVPSGRVHFSAEPDSPDPLFARAHFYHPVGGRDPFGNLSHIAYDPFDLAAVRTEDALGNVSTAQLDYRVMTPSLVTDQNGNRAGVAFDALGMVIATAMMGKEGRNEGDTLADPTVQIDYDLHQWQRLGKPNFVRTRSREQHGAANSRWQEAYSYSDGLGREVMKKVRAPAGLAPMRDAAGALLRDAAAKIVLDQVASRWIGNGRTVQDNKGNPVKQYEPYFSATSSFEDERDLLEQGVTPILRYDAQGRLIRTDMPDGTFARVEFDPWKQLQFDANDTVVQSRWYADRIRVRTGSAKGPAGDAAANGADARAAKSAAAHADTPTAVHADSLGRTFLTVSDNGAAGKYTTRVELDIQSRHKSLTDARGNRVMTQTHDLLGTIIHQASADAGETWQLPNIAGNPMWAWDSRETRIRHLYDALSRVTQLLVRHSSAPERIAERLLYGDSLADGAVRNARGKLYQHYDAGGVATMVQYDFKGNLSQHSRQLLANYKAEVDWATTPAPILEPTVYSSSTTFDALNRHVTVTTPDQSVATPLYDESNRLASLTVDVKGQGTPVQFVVALSHDAKGQREKIEYGNGVTTVYEHDPLNYRLLKLSSVRRSDGAALQQLSYTYDPIGNITGIRDGAQQTVYFSNQVVAPDAQFEYDPIYRLIGATGREHVGQSRGEAPGFDDGGRARLPHPNDAIGMTRYVERYEYDAVGNILRMLHNAASNGWSRRYDYAATSNRLNATNIPSDPDGVFSAAYEYDAEGNMVRMPHLPLLQWNYKNELKATARQRVGSGTPETTYYLYSSSGARVRKVTERQAAEGQTPTRKEERVYLDGCEIYRSYEGDGASLALERETLHIMDDKQRIALIETRTQGSDNSADRLTRYQFSNHLDCAVLELDDQAQVISYEEHYPYGSTSYEAVRSQTETPKRYRYTGKERDEESGFYYHGARYYAPWIGRWTSCDPAGSDDHINRYVYVHNNPIVATDPTGQWTWKQVGIAALVITAAVVITVATAGLGAAAVAAAATAVGGTALGASGAAAATLVGTVAVGALTGAASSAAADLTAQALTKEKGQAIDWHRTKAAAAGGAAAGGVLSIIPGLAAARSVGQAIRAGATAAEAVAATRAATAATGSIGRQLLTSGGKGAASGAVGGGVQETVRQSASGERKQQGGYDVEKIVGATVTGAAFGGAGGALGTGLRAGLRNIRVRAAATRAAGEPGATGPAAAAVHEPASDKILTGTNTAPSRPLHRLLLDRIREFKTFDSTTDPNYYAKAGQAHAETNALSEALYAREAALGREAGEGDLADLLLHVVNRKSDAAMPRCSSCSFITHGADTTIQQSSAEQAQFREILSGTYSRSNW